eukprot:3195330-Pyramimonas_sp.AAC.2
MDRPRAGAQRAAFINAVEHRMKEEEEEEEEERWKVILRQEQFSNAPCFFAPPEGGGGGAGKCFAGDQEAAPRATKD